MINLIHAEKNIAIMIPNNRSIIDATITNPENKEKKHIKKTLLHFLNHNSKHKR